MWNNQRAGQQHLNQAGHLFKRELRTRAKNCLRKNNWITTRGNKWLGDSQRAGHHQPDWETNQLPQGKTNEWETADSIESRTPPARLGDKSIATREDKWIGDSRQHRKPDTTSQTGRQMNCHKPETNELETAREPDTTSQTGRQVKCHEGGQMNWRQPKSRTPPARLGNKWVDIRADKWIGDSRRAGHHQPDWETNELI